jgi:hypothetical protein
VGSVGYSLNYNLSPLSVHKHNQGMKQTQEKFQETKRIIISGKSKDRQYNGQKKKENKCLKGFKCSFSTLFTIGEKV